MIPYDSNPPSRQVVQAMFGIVWVGIKSLFQMVINILLDPADSTGGRIVSATAGSLENSAGSTKKSVPPSEYEIFPETWVIKCPH